MADRQQKKIVEHGIKPQDIFTAKDKVQILLSEYSSLRTETIHRVNNVFQLLGISAVAFVWFLGHKRDATFWFGLMVCIPACCFYTLNIFRDISKSAKRVRELETEINRRVGEELLEWETWWGGGFLRFGKRKYPAS